MVGVLDPKFCPGAKAWRGSYGANKVYLGIDRTLPTDVSVQLSWEFRNTDEEQEFFTFWAEQTNSGAKPFYVMTGLYGERKHYLVSLTGELDHTKRPLGVSGKFELYRTRTLDENTPPLMEAQSFSVDMDSTSNFIHIMATDYDQIVYSIVTSPAHGTVVLREGGVVYYTPTDNFSGTDTFVVRVTDELEVSEEAMMSINVVDWKANEQFKLVMTQEGHLLVDYVDVSTVDQDTQDILSDLSVVPVTVNHNSEVEVDISTATHITNITKDGDGNILIEGV